jgi:hypothetical protein
MPPQRQSEKATRGLWAALRQDNLSQSGCGKEGRRDAALLLSGGYLATSPAVVETFHFEVPPLSLVVRSPQYRCTAETLEDVAPFARLPTRWQAEPFTGLSDALDGDQPPHAAPFPEFPVIVGYYGASVRLTTWLPLQARTTDPRFSPMARRARYRCPVCRSAIFAFSLQSRLDCFPLRATVAEGTSGVGFMPRFLSSPYEQELRLPPLCHGCLDARPFLSERPPPLFPVFDLGVS